MNEVPRVLSAPVHAQSASGAGSVNPSSRPLLPVLERVTGRDPVAGEKTVERTTARVTSTVVFVSDLSRSVEFYRDVFSCEVRVEAYEAALLLSPRGLQMYLIARGARAPHHSGGIGLQCLIWGVDKPDALNDLEQAMQARGGRTYRHTRAGITFLTGRDPDGIRIVVTHPSPEVLPRVVIDNCLYAW